MLYNPVIEIAGDGKDQLKRLASIAQLLGNPAMRSHINTSSCGIYFEERSNLLLVLLDQALVRLLPPMYKNKGTMKSPQLRQILMRNAFALTHDEILTSGVLERSTHFLGKNVKAHDIAVFRADDWVTTQTKDSQAEESNKKQANTTIPKPMIQKGLVSRDRIEEITSDEEISRYVAKGGEDSW
jgi:hypothetical protein